MEISIGPGEQEKKRKFKDNKRREVKEQRKNKLKEHNQAKANPKKTHEQMLEQKKQELDKEQLD